MANAFCLQLTICLPEAVARSANFDPYFTQDYEKHYTKGSTSSHFEGWKGELPQNINAKMPQKLAKKIYFVVQKKNDN